MRRSILLLGGVGSFVACANGLDLGSHAPPSDAGVAEGSVTSDGGDPVVPVDSGHEGKFLFVTDGRYVGDLRSEGGAATGPLGADSICNREAKMGGIGGVFKAWISTSTENAKDRIAPVGPWRLIDDTVIFPGRVVTGAPLAYPRITPSGKVIYASDAPGTWTGTDFYGVVNEPTSTCEDWTSSNANIQAHFGSVVGMGSDWTDYGLSSDTAYCSARLRLYCFEQ